MKVGIRIDSQKMNNYSLTCDFWNSFNIVFTSAAIFADELLVSFEDKSTNVPKRSVNEGCHTLKITGTWRSGYCYLNKGECDLNQSKDNSFVERVAKNNN